MEKLEIGDVLKLRKSLLLTSAIGFFLENIKNYSTGEIKLIGFSIPVKKDGSEITNFIGFVILFFFISLSIRYLDKSFKHRYIQKLNDFPQLHKMMHFQDPNPSREFFINKEKWKLKTFDYLILILDLIIPLIIGLSSMLYIWC